jgi:hypothetical protein
MNMSLGGKIVKSFFNRALEHGLLTGNYFCSECAGLMEFEDDNEDILVCPKCGHSVELEAYGFDDPEDYNSLYPSEEDVDDD